MKFELPCDPNIALILVSHLENAPNIDFVSVDQPHFLKRKIDTTKLIIHCENQKVLHKQLKKAVMEISGNFLNFYKQFESGLKCSFK